MNKNIINKAIKSAVIGISSGSFLIAKAETNNISTNNYLKNKTNDFKTNIVKTDHQFLKVHECAGKNICRGLGGCKVTDQELIKRALKMGLNPTNRVRIGVPHGCYGLNECKGLGGCKVTEKKFKMMKRRKRFYIRKRKTLLKKYNAKKQMGTSSSSSSASPISSSPAIKD